MSSEPQESSGLGSFGSSEAKGSSSLGSLGQSARKKKLNQVRWILIGIGALTILLNILDIAQIPDLTRQGRLTASLAQLCYVVDGAFVVVGVVFVMLGLLVHSHPVPVTILALVLYIGSYFIAGLLFPVLFLQGIIIKIIIVVVLGKAIQTGIAYQKEEQEAAQAAEMGL